MNTHKAIRFLMVVIVFLFVQSMFLAMIIKERYATDILVTMIVILILTLSMFLRYRQLDLHHEEHDYESISVAIWVPVGAVGCYLLNIDIGLGSVLAAGIIGTVASFLPSLDKQSTYLSKLPPAIYCGAFIGMSSTEITPSINFVIAAGVLAGVFYMLSKSLFLGIGGKLGTIAFGSLVIISLIHWLSI